MGRRLDGRCRGQGRPEHGDREDDHGGRASGRRRDRLALGVGHAGPRGRRGPHRPETGSVRSTTDAGRRPPTRRGRGGLGGEQRRRKRVSRLDPRTGAVTDTITIGGSPQDVVVAGHRVWVSVRPRAAMEAQDNIDFLDPALAYSPESGPLLDATCAKLSSSPSAPGSRGNAAGSRSWPRRLRAAPPMARAYTFTIPAAATGSVLPHGSPGHEVHDRANSESAHGFLLGSAPRRTARRRRGVCGGPGAAHHRWRRAAQHADPGADQAQRDATRACCASGLLRSSARHADPAPKGFPASPPPGILRRRAGPGSGGRTSSRDPAYGGSRRGHADEIQGHGERGREADGRFVWKPVRWTTPRLPIARQPPTSRKVLQLRQAPRRQGGAAALLREADARAGRDHVAKRAARRARRLACVAR